jgi:hypothetical protein
MGFNNRMELIKVCVWVLYIAWLKFIYMDDISCLIVMVYIFIFRKNLFRAYVCTVYQMSNQNKTFLSYLILSYVRWFSTDRYNTI